MRSVDQGEATVALVYLVGESTLQKAMTGMLA